MTTPPGPHPPGIPPAMLAQHLRREAAAADASSDPLPGPLAAAFADPPDQVAGLTVRPVVHADFVILKKLNSPILATLTGKRPDKSTRAQALTDDSVYDLIYQFTRPCQEVERDVDKLGAKEFRARARQLIGYTLGPVEVMLLSKAIEGQFARAFSTVIGYQAKPAEDGSFPTPPPPAQTASAGGSTTSAAS